MINSLPLFHRIEGQPVIVLGTGDAAEAKTRLVRRAGGMVITDMQEGIDKGARLAFVAHDNPAATDGDVIRLRCAGLLVNAVDRPDLCDFTVPSLLDRSPVLVAIGTGGASAGLAKALRLRLETLIPQSLGALACALGLARQRLRQRWPDAGERRRALDEALGTGGTLDPLSESSAAAIDRWLTSSVAESRSGLAEISLRSDDPEDLTLRDLRLLGSADSIAHTATVPQSILNRARADARRVVLAEDEVPVIITGLTVVLRRAAPPA